MKDVIISSPDYHKIVVDADVLNNKIDMYLNQYRNMGYKTFWFDKEYDIHFTDIKNELELMLNSLANSRHSSILNKAEEYPVLVPNQRPFSPVYGRKDICLFCSTWINIKTYFKTFEFRLNKDLKTGKH